MWFKNEAPAAIGPYREAAKPMSKTASLMRRFDTFQQDVDRELGPKYLYFDFKLTMFVCIQVCDALNNIADAIKSLRRLDQ